MAKMGTAFGNLVREAKKSPHYWKEIVTLNFANALANIMKNKNMKGYELAEAVGTSPAYVTKVLKGDVNYTVETMVKFAMALDAEVQITIQPKYTMIANELNEIKHTRLKDAYQPSFLSLMATNDNVYDTNAAAA